MKKPPKTQHKRYEDRPGLVNVIIQLRGDDAERFLHYQKREKLHTHGQAGYKLMFERLDEIEGLNNMVGSVTQGG